MLVEKNNSLLQNCRYLNLINRFRSGVTWSIAGAAVSRLLNLLGWVIVARILGQTSFGELGIVQSTITTIGTIAGLGLGKAATKYIAQYKMNDLRRAGKIICLTLLTSNVIAFVVGVIFLVFCSNLLNSVIGAPHLLHPLMMGVGVVCLSIIIGVQMGVLAGFESFRSIARINIGTGLLSLPLIIISAYFMNIEGVIGALTIVYLLQWILLRKELVVQYRRSGIKLNYRQCWNEKKILWDFTLPVAISSFIVPPVIWFSNVRLVKLDSGFDLMAIFKAAEQWQSALLFLPLSLSPLVLSILSNSHSHNKTEYWDAVKLSVVINGGLVAIGCVILCVFSKVIMFSYGPGFSDGWIVLVLLAISALFVTVNGVIANIIASSASMWWGLMLNVIWAIAFTVSVNLLIDEYGVNGLAASYLISYFFLLLFATLYLYYVSRKIGADIDVTPMSKSVILKK